MLARDEWIPGEPDEPSYEAAYLRADAWLRTLTMAASAALIAVACCASLEL